MEVEKRKNKVTGFVKEWGWCFVLGVVLPLIVTSIFTKINVSGNSMLPTYHENEKLFLSKIGSIKNQDVVVIDCESEGEEFYIIKRVIAVPNDKLRISGNDVFVNESKISEEYIKDANWNEDHLFDIEMILNENEYYVMGDNRLSSMDSRYIGPVFEKNILGKIIF